MSQQAERPICVGVRTSALYCLCRHWCIRSSRVLAPTRQGCSGEMWRLTSTQLLNFHTLLTAILPGANARLVCPPWVPAVFTCVRACCSHSSEVRWKNFHLLRWRCTSLIYFIHLQGQHTCRAPAPKSDWLSNIYLTYTGLDKSGG